MNLNGMELAKILSEEFENYWPGWIDLIDFNSIIQQYSLSERETELSFRLEKILSRVNASILTSLSKNELAKILFKELRGTQLAYIDPYAFDNIVSQKTLLNEYENDILLCLEKAASRITGLAALKTLDKQ